MRVKVSNVELCGDISYLAKGDATAKLVDHDDSSVLSTNIFVKLTMNEKNKSWSLYLPQS